jgi:DNA-binding transcriptional ArsR family regulator
MSDACDILCLDLPAAEAARASLPSADAVETAAARGRALADPTRLTIAAALADADELCVCDLAWIVDRPQNLVSHHLRTLRQAGLVRARKDGKLLMCSLTEPGRALLLATFGEAAAHHG